MKPGWWPAIMGVLVGALAGSLVFAPARWVGYALEKATGGQVLLTHTRGTLWRGEGRLVLTGNGGTLALPGTVSWRWLMRPNVEGRAALLGWELGLSCCASEPLRAAVARREDQWQLLAPAWHSRWHLGWTQALGSPWNTLGLQGTLELTVLPLQWPLTGGHTATLSWEARIADLASAVATVQPLGSYRLVGRWSAHTATVTLDSERGPLRLHGRGTWDKGRFRFEGVAEADADRLDALSNLLNLLGRRDGPRAHLRFG